MSELKPKHDNELAADQIKGGADANAPQVSKETKPHGDKLQNVFDSEKPKAQKPH